MANERRVVLTGLGAVTPLGIGVEKYWQGLLAGRSGVSRVDGFDCSAIATRVAAHVRDFRPEDYMERKEAKRMDRFAQFAAAAAKMAVADAELPINDETRARVGVFIGSGIGGIATFEEQHSKLIEGGLSRVSPFFIPMMIANMGTGNVAKMLGAQGPSETAVTACATSTNSIGDAYLTIKRGEADAATAGGSEAAIVPISMAGFSNMRAMTTRNDDPEHASRPFDVGRDGFILGEGSGIVVLEDLDTARARGAKIYAEVVGYGLSGDAYHVTAPHPEGSGAFRSMQMAMKKSGLDLADIDYINAHGTSTPLGDELELGAVRKLFGNHIATMSMSSTKSAIGHLLGGAGAVESIFCILAIRDQIVPPTLNLDNPSEGTAGVDLVPHVAKKRKVKAVLNNSFGFGGTNASLVMRAI